MINMVCIQERRDRYTHTDICTSPTQKERRKVKGGEEERWNLDWITKIMIDVICDHELNSTDGFVSQPSHD